jgi:hypothetical protein
VLFNPLEKKTDEKIEVYLMFEKVKVWLKQMGLNFAYNQELNLFHLPYNIDGNQFSVVVGVFPDANWLKIAALIVPAESVPSGLYEALLKEMWNLFEVTYSVDENGNVFSENDIPFSSNFENFQSELQAVVFGVTHFFKVIAPKFKIIPKGTFGMKTPYSG